MSFNFQTKCIKGDVRSNNEDTIRYGELPKNSGIWMIVADGMGGHNAGEVASNMLADWMEKAITETKFTVKNTSLIHCWLKGTLESANRVIFAESNQHESCKGMGTTAVVALVIDKQLHIAWVGDSRAYLLHDNKLQQLTRDHSMIEYLLKKGAISEHEAKRSNTKHLLSKAIGVKANVEAESVSLDWNDNDVIMLTSDGTHDFISDAEISNHLGCIHTNNSAANNLVELAIGNGSRDNLSVVIGYKTKN